MSLNLITITPPVQNKVTGQHRDRLAIVYVRQSTLQQHERCQESTQLQYGLAEHACRLGWPRSKVLVIDEDLGCSGASTEGRHGFQRLVAEVGLGHVGLVLGFEVSRLARSCRDWYQLLEICALAGTLIADSDGVYDPTTYNDRLLLGLKGTMSEAELHIMRARLDEGRRHKAARGELGLHVAHGYMRHPSGEVILDPDERARAAIECVFDVFERRRSVHGTLNYLVTHGVKLPDRMRYGPAKGELGWTLPERSAIIGILTNPIYAGAYVYGRRSPHRSGGRPRSTPSRATTDWQVFIKDRLPAYISWERFEEIQKQLRANQSKHGGTPRGGPSLLAGILICGRCGYRMATCYRNNGRGLRYQCMRGHISYARSPCQAIMGSAIDPAVGALLLEVMKPSAIEVSLAVAEDIELERKRERRQRSLNLEQAAYEVERLERQYNAVEPENRLVARTLEARWEAALAEHERLKVENARIEERTPPTITEKERAAIRRLANDIPAIWAAQTTTAAERKEIARLLLDQVTLFSDGSEKFEIECRWVGGDISRHKLEKSVRWTSQLTNYDALRTRIIELAEAGLRPPAIARQLNAEEWRSAHGTPFNASKVWSLLLRLGRKPTNAAPSTVVVRDPGEMTVAEIASALDQPVSTIYYWIYKGWLPIRRVTALNRELYLIHLSDAQKLVTERQIAAKQPQKWLPPTPVD